MNCILNSGEVPDLFDNEETDWIAMELKTAASHANIPDTRQAVFQFFVQVLCDLSFIITQHMLYMTCIGDIQSGIYLGIERHLPTMDKSCQIVSILVNISETM